MEPGVYLFKDRSAEEHELHKVFDGVNWYFGAAGVVGALQVAEMAVKSGEFDLKGPSKPPLRIEVLGQADAARFARIAGSVKN